MNVMKTKGVPQIDFFELFVYDQGSTSNLLKQIVNIFLVLA
tara:strand:+ start:390 stop:512 length:123 start_codon:yes stop_codon:yes gene_type:complete